MVPVNFLQHSEEFRVSLSIRFIRFALVCEWVREETHFSLRRLLQEGKEGKCEFMCR
jgi:hypothetical protein